VIKEEVETEEKDRECVNLVVVKDVVEEEKEEGKQELIFIVELTN
jgi:hypothetical protein